MKCPGQDSRYWKPGAIFNAPCPKCTRPVEFFKDDTARRCDHCGHRFVNPRMDFGCAAYCEYAEQCLGTLPEELANRREDLLKDRVAVEMKRYLGRDFKRIGHATRVARYAERIGRAEGGNPAVILAAAYLYDIGSPEAERKYGSSAPEFQEKTGPPVARGILSHLGAGDRLIEAVCALVGHRAHPWAEGGTDFNAVHDAETLAVLEERHKESPLEREALAGAIAERLRTASGRAIAREILPGG